MTQRGGHKKAPPVSGRRRRKGRASDIRSPFILPLRHIPRDLPQLPLGNKSPVIRLLQRQYPVVRRGIRSQVDERILLPVRKPACPMTIYFFSNNSFRISSELSIFYNFSPEEAETTFASSFQNRRKKSEKYKGREVAKIRQHKSNCFAAAMV